MIYLTLCILLPIENHLYKQKIWGHLCPQESNIWSQNNFWLLKAHFWLLRAQIASNFRFCVWLLISYKVLRFWYITRRIFCANFENRFFYSILQYCQFYGSAQKLAAVEKTIVFAFRMKNCINLNGVFRILRPKLN